MVQKSLDSVKKYLDFEHGIVLNYPAFTEYVVEYGEISSYQKGYKENGAVFSHNNPWIIIGETVLGRGDYAWDYYKKYVLLMLKKNVQNFIKLNHMFIVK